MVPIKNNIRLRDFNKERYMALVRSIPGFREEKNQAYFMVSLTFLSLSVLGLFAINPTLTTIAELSRKREDSTMVAKALKTKMDNLSNLHTQYDANTDTWVLVDKQIPNDPKVTTVIAQVQRIAKQTGVEIRSVQTYQVELTKQTIQTPGLPKESSFTFTVSVTGPEAKMMQFAEALLAFDRTIAVEGLQLTQGEEQILSIQIRAFFLP